MSIPFTLAQNKAVAGLHMRQSKLFRIVVGITLLFFAIQSYMVATHIHWLPQAAPVSAGMYSHPPKNGPQPLTPDNCPLCQAALHAGSFLSPAAFAAAPVELVVMPVPLRFVLPVRPPPTSHIWCGRAPPAHN